MNIQPIEHEAVGAMAALAAATQSSTQLITLDPAKYVAEVFKPFNDKFSILKAEADAITPDASTPAGMEICIKYRAGFRDDVRVGGERVRVERKAPILQIGKLLDSEYRKLADAVAPYEAKFHNAIEAEKKRREELKAAETARKEALRQRVVAIRELPVTAVGKSSAEIGLMLVALEADAPDETFGDLLDAAKVARVEVMTKLATLQAAVSASEVETARVAAAMAELAQMRAEAAERARLAQIEADRLAAERKAEDDRRAALIAEQEAAALRQREAQAAELKKQADAQAERNRLEQAEIARQRQELLDMQADAKARADAEAARLVEAAAQAERDRVAADTKRQLDQQAADTAAARAAALVEQGRLADLADQPTSMAPADELADAKASPDGSDLSPAAQDLFEQEGATNFERAHTPPTLRLGQISDRLGFTVTASFMESLGFAPAATDKAAKLYHEGDFKSMCAAICRHISAVQVKHAI